MAKNGSKSIPIPFQTSARSSAPANVEAERGIILNEELRKHRKFVERAKTMRRFYPTETGLHHPGVGFPEDINRISTDHLTTLYTRHFHPRNLLCVATGKIEHQALVTALEKHGSAEPQNRPDQVIQPNVLKVEGSKPFRLKKRLQYGSPYLEIHTRVSDDEHEQVAFRLGQEALCNYMHGPIYQEWRFRQRKMYDIAHKCTIIPDHQGHVETTLYEVDHAAFQDFFWKCAQEAPSSPVFHKALKAVLNDLDTQDKRRKTRPFNAFEAISDARDLFHKGKIGDPKEWRLVTTEEVAEATRRHWSPDRCTIIRGVRRGF